MTALKILAALMFGASIDTFNKDGSGRWGNIHLPSQVDWSGD